ncbi:RimJ/RimL family protein N-acetyltransferase [Arcticibacter pallidicorallinus]|uniref:RimJ/RimL family protein N-acetyltransferase n=1 Tax=Arcticibacter pallidicorallinus TaxID=1259464 RepID=A0A2T0U4B5_9SPHI|nr:GNAT family N-acetyltransferase [Arcticibacter pallidicorallinus]PRY52763.1 RimJ/RimL family protein N-acetyltransferase [Arcticibacter pallidicorallinus]
MADNSLFISKYTPNDFHAYHSLVMDDDVMRYISGTGLSEEDAQAKFNSILSINAQQGSLGYFKVYNHQNTFIGDCKLERSKDSCPALEIGYILKKDFWGQGYGTEICTRLLALAHQVAPTLDVVAIIDPENTASKKLLKKCGFRSFFIGVENGLATEKLIHSKISK